MGTKARIIVFYKDDTILDIYEFELKTRKDGLSKPLCDMLWIAEHVRPEGGRIEIVFI